MGRFIEIQQLTKEGVITKIKGIRISPSPLNRSGNSFSAYVDVNRPGTKGRWKGHVVTAFVGYPILSDLEIGDEVVATISRTKIAGIPIPTSKVVESIQKK